MDVCKGNWESKAKGRRQGMECPTYDILHRDALQMSPCMRFVVYFLNVCADFNITSKVTSGIVSKPRSRTSTEEHPMVGGLLCTYFVMALSVWDYLPFGLCLLIATLSFRAIALEVTVIHSLIPGLI